MSGKSDMQPVSQRGYMGPRSMAMSMQPGQDQGMSQGQPPPAQRGYYGPVGMAMSMQRGQQQNGGQPGMGQVTPQTPPQQPQDGGQGQGQGMAQGQPSPLAALLQGRFGDLSSMINSRGLAGNGNLIGGQMRSAMPAWLRRY